MCVGSSIVMATKVLFLALVAACVQGTDLLELEIRETAALITNLKQKNDLLRDLKTLMVSEGSEIPVNCTQTREKAEEYREMELADRLGQSPLLRQLRAYAGFEAAGDIADIKVISTYFDHKESVLIALCEETGRIELFDHTGRLVSSLSTPHPLSLCSFSTPAEELRLTTLSNANHVLYSYRVFGVLNQSEEVRVESDGEESVPGTGKSLGFTVRMSRKHWVLTEESGDVLTLHYNGTVMRRASIGLSPVLGTDKGSHQLIFITPKQLGIYHLGSQETSQTCEPSFHPISAMAAEPGSQYVFVALDNGDVMVYDMKYAPGHGIPTTCKGKSHPVVYRYPNVLQQGPWALAVVKGNLLAWGSSLTFLNTSYIDSDRPTSPIRLQVVPKMTAHGKALLETFKYQNGTTLVVLAKGREVTLVEAALPTIEQPAGSFFDFSLGNFRLVA